MNGLTYFLAGASLGMIVFQSALLTPLVFKQLTGDIRGAFLRSLFPRFFLVLAGLGFAITAYSLAVGSYLDGALGGAVVALALLACAILPATNRARDEGRTGTFKQLHLASVVLTLTIGVIDLLLLMI